MSANDRCFTSPRVIPVHFFDGAGSSVWLLTGRSETSEAFCAGDA